MDIGGWNVKYDLCDHLLNDYKNHFPLVCPNVAGRQKVQGIHFLKAQNYISFDKINKTRHYGHDVFKRGRNNSLTYPIESGGYIVDFDAYSWFIKDCVLDSLEQRG